jgi:hypothetical protein
LTNIANTWTVTAVIADGTYISQKQLNEMKSKLRALAAQR